MKTPVVLVAVAAACSAPSSPPASPNAAPAPRVVAPATAGLHAAEPTVVDDAVLARMIAGPTDRQSFVSPKRGVVAWKGDYIDRYCGEQAARELAALVVTMRGAKCESSTIQSLCETTNPTHIVELVHEDGSWYGYGITYDEPDDLSDKERRDFDPMSTHDTCTPMHRLIDWDSYTPEERARNASRRRHVPAAAPAVPPPSRAPSTQDFAAAPNILRKEPTLGCTVKYVSGYLQIRCPLAGKGHGLIDTHVVPAAQLDVTDTDVTWTVERTTMSAFLWVFDTGGFELASSTTEASWVEEGTFRPGGAERTRTVMSCCIAKHSARACIGRDLLGGVDACKAKLSSCTALDACLQAAGKP